MYGVFPKDAYGGDRPVWGFVLQSAYGIMGVWTQAGKRYEDELFRLTIDVEERPENNQTTAHLKAELLERLSS